MLSLHKLGRGETKPSAQCAAASTRAPIPRSPSPTVVAAALPATRLSVSDRNFFFLPSGPQTLSHRKCEIFYLRKFDNSNLPIFLFAGQLSRAGWGGWSDLGQQPRKHACAGIDPACTCGVASIALTVSNFEHNRMPLLFLTFVYGVLDSKAIRKQI